MSASRRVSWAELRGADSTLGQASAARFQTQTSDTLLGETRMAPAFVPDVPGHRTVVCPSSAEKALRNLLGDNSLLTFRSQGTRGHKRAEICSTSPADPPQTRSSLPGLPDLQLIFCGE